MPPPPCGVCFAFGGLPPPEGPLIRGLTGPGTPSFFIRHDGIKSDPAMTDKGANGGCCLSTVSKGPGYDHNCDY